MGKAMPKPTPTPISQTAGCPPWVDMLDDSARAEWEITNRLYKDFSSLRTLLLDELRKTHSHIPAAELIPLVQTVLDRVLFIAFAEDRNLLPPNTLAKAFEHRDPYFPRPVWRNFLGVFRSIDKGNPDLDIAAYNGGIFRDVAALEHLAVSDAMCAEFKRLGEYDFSEDVSVDVLGHIFEQSISDLEVLHAELSAPEAQPKQLSKRKREGVFYTPPFVTQYLVRETLGRACAEAFERSGGLKATSKRARKAAWQAYQEELRNLRVLDPACGSGAFLVAAFDLLNQEFVRCNEALAELHGDDGGVLNLTKTMLNENLFGIDKSSEAVEIARLSLWLKTAERGKKLTFIDRNVRQGNSVVSDPSVDPYAFDWHAGRVAQPFLEYTPADEDVEQIDARWREGFDVVIGNPPYVRQELLAPYKGHWRETFRVYDGTADLFVYFFERGLEQLKPGGRLGFIVSNKWMRGGYAERLRELLAGSFTIEQMVDFGDAPIFPDAVAFPCIIVVRKVMPEKDHLLRVTLYPRAELWKEQMASYVESHQFELPQGRLDKAGWTLEHPRVLALMDKLRERGVPLSEYAGGKPYFGIKTGFNAAFLVDQTTKERLCREDPRSAEILKKYLRGRDIARWSPQWDRCWVIFARHGIDIDGYPAIRAHLQRFRKQIEPRPADYVGNRWPGRKQGAYRWCEIQDAVDYYRFFEGPKLVWKDISCHSEFSLDRLGHYADGTCFIYPEPNLWLLAVLNSPAMWAWLSRNTIHGINEALRLKSLYIMRAPIPKSTTEQAERAAVAVERVVELTRSMHESVAATLDVLRMEWGVDSPGQALSTFDSLDSDAFVAEVRKRRGKDAGRLSSKDLAELRKLFETDAPPLSEMRAEILRLERTIAGLVHAAWGLDEGDLATLRETAPQRMPPGW